MTGGGEVISHSYIPGCQVLYDASLLQPLRLLGRLLRGVTAGKVRLPGHRVTRLCIHFHRPAFLECGGRKSIVSLAALGQINEVVKPPYRVVGNNTIWNWESCFAKWN